MFADATIFARGRVFGSVRLLALLVAVLVSSQRQYNEPQKLDPGRQCRDGPDCKRTGCLRVETDPQH